MNSTRRTSVAAGALFILAIVTVLAATALEPFGVGTDYLTGAAEQPNRLGAAALLHLFAAGSSVGIVVVLYPLLKQINATLALGAVGFRTIEAVFYTAAVVSLLSISSLGRQLATAPVEDQAVFRALADVLVSMREHSTLVAVCAFTVGALMYYLLLFQARLVPRWLSGWGLAVLLMMTTGVLSLFSDSPVTGYTFLFLPIAAQEMVLAGWLLVKGFRPLPPTGTASAEARLLPAPTAQPS